MDANVRNSLISILQLLSHRAHDKHNSVPVVPTGKVLDMLSGTGIEMTYQELQDALHSDPSLASKVSDINKNTIKLSLDGSTASVMPPAKTPLMPYENDDDLLDTDLEGETAAPVGNEEEPAIAPEAPPTVPMAPNPVQTMAKRAAKRMK